MLTLRRFEELVDTYGADLRRWPEELRADGRALMSVSPEARALLPDAQALDDVIEAARSADDALRWRPGEQEMALVRLRAGVAARIAASPAPLPSRERFAWWPAVLGRRVGSPRLRLIGLAAGGAFAIVGGLLLGATYESAPPPTGVLTSLLQPAAIGTLAD
jgi:hypothetical protein